MDNIDLSEVQQKAAEGLASQTAYDEIGLNDKMIEPYIKEGYSDHVNRNIQNGNFTVPQFNEYMDHYNLSLTWLDVPADFGGCDFAHKLAETKLK
ncbi:hypothetical protein DRH27_02265, partial [Candidatus Falkowbacteria bacterium]